MRIVSLLPSTTEILFDLGAGDDVVGVTFECDHPVEARSRTIVSTSAMPEGLTPPEIDAFVADAMRAGEDLYHLDEGALAGLDADLVVTQDLCAVCAVDVSVVDDALAHLGCTAEVLTIDPHTLDEVLASVGTLGRATGTEARADAAGRRRCAPGSTRSYDGPRTGPRPRVLVLEWTDPPFAPGHWVPEMVARRRRRVACSARPARSRSGSPGTTSGPPAPEVVVCAPCGYGLEQSPRAGRGGRRRGRAARGTSRCGPSTPTRRSRGPDPRLVDGVEALAGILHPDVVGASPIAARVR